MHPTAVMSMREAAPARMNVSVPDQLHAIPRFESVTSSGESSDSCGARSVVICNSGVAMRAHFVHSSADRSVNQATQEERRQGVPVDRVQCMRCR
jgi:hypothetical protein